MQEYVSVSEAARQLGVHNITIYRMLQRGEISGAVRVRKAIRIPVQALRALPRYASSAPTTEGMEVASEDA